LHWPPFTAARYSFAVLYGVSALTQRMKRSSASRATGVKSFQLNGVPVASGVVNRLERDDQRVVVALLALDVEEAFGSGPAGLVDDHHRPRGEIVLFRDAGDETGHLIGAAAGAGRDDELDGLGGLPGCRRRWQQRERAGGEHEREQTRDIPHRGPPLRNESES
jgi:hypothetical protein